MAATTIKRPRVTRAPGDHYHAPGERMIEFLFPDGGGGLISFRTLSTGLNVIDIMRIDAGDDDEAGGVAVGVPGKGKGWQRVAPPRRVNGRIRR